MFYRIILFSILLLVVAAVAIPESAHAQGQRFWRMEYLNGPLAPSCNPVGGCTLCHLFEVVQNVIYFGASLAVFILAPVFISIGGITIMAAGGSEERAGRGKKILYSAVIGLAIVLGAFVIVNTVVTFLGITLIQGSSTASWAGFSCSP